MRKGVILHIQRKIIIMTTMMTRLGFSRTIQRDYKIL